jgi:thioesterase domain-containing protein
MGVAIAFEMAQQLRAQGREPALLILLDQGPFLPERIPEDNAEYLIQVFGKQMSLSLDHLRTLDEDRQIAYVLERGKKARFIFPDLNFANFRFFVSILRSHTQAWQDYQPQPYPGRVVLVRAKKQSEKGDQSPDMGWAEYLTGEFEIYQVPGDHISMVYPPDVKALARRIASILDGLLVKA